MREPIIEFKDFSFKYRSQKEPTLKNINLKIYPGEKILIAGRSGCGKSTLAHCLNALIPGSIQGDISGNLRVCGNDPGKLGVFGMSKIVGTVLQDTDGQFIALTVAEDLAFALENENTPQDELFEKVGDVAKKLDISDLLECAPGELSGGQKQRVSLGGVMVCDVKILLFDEPLANLDPATGKRIIELMDDLCKNDDMTIVIVEHRIEDVLHRDIDRVVVLSEGEIVADMTPDELLCSDVLSTHGIREPLYITALKAAGADITPDTHPQHIESMLIDPYKENVRQWFHKTERQKSKTCDDTILEIENLCFSYDGINKTIDNASFKVKRGELFALVGKNGAGKSTLSSLICGFNKPNTGRILLEGADIADLSVKERGEKIGYVMQNPNQMISKTMISEEVGLGLFVKGVPQDEIIRRVNETLKICGLYPYRNWPISALSFGQKKRVTIASILVMKPEILILDEPTAGQDYAHYTDIMEFILKIKKELGITIMMITHDMHLMLEYTDRCIAMADGQLIMDAKPFDVLTDEAICDRAYLKKTSLYELSLKCGIDDPSEFTARFIDDERRRRKEACDEQNDIL